MFRSAVLCLLVGCIPPATTRPAQSSQRRVADDCERRQQHQLVRNALFGDATHVEQVALRCEKQRGYGRQTVVRTCTGQ